MTALKLKTVTRTQGNNRALKERAVAPATCELEFVEVPVITGADPLPYGIAPNLQMLEAFMRDVVRQGIIDRPMRVETLFHPETREVVG